jgi:hypothetical protein
MKNLLLLFSLLFFSFQAKADTIDFCHVYYNNIKILDINFFQPNEHVLKLDSIQYNDSITIRYFRDTPCFDCLQTLTVENEKHAIFFTETSIGTFSPLTFSVQQLVELQKQGYLQSFEVFYSNELTTSRTMKRLILRIQLE